MKLRNNRIVVNRDRHVSNNMIAYPYFLRFKGGFMKQQHYIKSLDDAFDIYGRDNLVPISFIKQQIFLASHNGFNAINSDFKYHPTSLSLQSSFSHIKRGWHPCFAKNICCF